MSRVCDGCGARVEDGGGVDDLWSFGDAGEGAVLLELADGSDHRLCFDCVERLPDDRPVTAEDVAALEDAPAGTDDAPAGTDDAPAGTDDDESADGNDGSAGAA
jgi:hypothetical protein